jgi:microcystin-dependent protein
MPNEPIKGLNTPNTGDLVGAWGTTAVNANMQAIGGMLGGLATISLSGATTIALTAPSGSLTPGAGPTQQQNALLRFTGTQTGTATIQFTVPGFFIIDNQCIGTTFPIVLAPAVGTGNQIGVPFGCKTQVFFDGTNVDYVNPPLPGTAIDQHGVYGALNYPPWMLAGTTPYALVKDGTIHTASLFPALAAILGSTYGGNGVTTFGLPDERNRMRVAWDPNGLGRITAGGSGINGGTMGATGGSELAQQHTHANTLNDPGHTHTIPGVVGASGGSNQSTPIGPPWLSGATLTSSSSTTSITITNAAANSGNSQNMPPTIVSFLALIKT